RGGEHEHPHDVAGGHQLPDQLVTVHTGQVAVEDHHVVPGEGGLLVALHAVVGHVDGRALGPQPPRDGVGPPTLVLPHQYPHGQPSPSCWAAACSVGAPALGGRTSPASWATVSVICLATACAVNPRSLSRSPREAGSRSSCGSASRC